MEGTEGDGPALVDAPSDPCGRVAEDGDHCARRRGHPGKCSGIDLVCGHHGMGKYFVQRHSPGSYTLCFSPTGYTYQTIGSYSDEASARAAWLAWRTELSADNGGRL